MFIMTINITLKFSNLENSNVDYASNTVEELCSIADFLNDTSYIEFGAGNSCSSKDLYSSYVRWCDANALPPFKNNAFIHWLKDNSERLNIEYSKHIAKDNDINVRGFKGLKILHGNNYILMSTPNQNDCNDDAINL